MELLELEVKNQIEIIDRLVLILQLTDLSQPDISDLDPDDYMINFSKRSYIYT